MIEANRRTVLGELHRMDLRSELGRVGCPVLVIAIRDDPDRVWSVVRRSVAERAP
jgi:hypothetical protein